MMVHTFIKLIASLTVFVVDAQDKISLHERQHIVMKTTDDGRDAASRETGCGSFRDR